MISQECIPVGYVPTTAVTVSKCYYRGGDLPPDGVCLQGESAWGGAGKGLFNPPPVDRMIDRALLKTLPALAVGKINILVIANY